MGNICPPNKNSSHTNGGRSTGYIANEPGGIKVGSAQDNQNSYPIVNIANGNVGYNNHPQHDIIGEWWLRNRLDSFTMSILKFARICSGMYPSQQHQNFQMRNGFSNHVDHNAGIMGNSPSSVVLMARNNSTDSGEKPNFIALFDYEQVNFFDIF